MTTEFDEVMNTPVGQANDDDVDCKEYEYEATFEEGDTLVVTADCFYVAVKEAATYGNWNKRGDIVKMERL